MNYALSGRTTETFRDEGHWSRMESALGTGDLALFQFGHNDQKRPHLAAGGGYSENLRRYVAETRTRGATAVLVSPVSRSLWNGPGGSFNDLLEPWARAVEAVADETGAHFLDLHKVSTQLVLRWGKEGGARYFHPGDYTHFNDIGAWEIARLVQKELMKLFPERPWWRDRPHPFPLPPTRAEALASILSRCIILPSQDYREAFADVGADDWYAGTVQAAFDKKLLPSSWEKFEPGRLLSDDERDEIIQRAARSNLAT